jgi:adenosine deaminase
MTGHRLIKWYQVINIENNVKYSNIHYAPNMDRLRATLSNVVFIADIKYLPGPGITKVAIASANISQGSRHIQLGTKYDVNKFKYNIIHSHTFR